MSYPETIEAIPGTEPGGAAVAIESNKHLHENGGVFILNDRTPNLPDQIHEIYGQVDVGKGTTHYKGYFPENRTHDGIGYLFHGYMAFMKSSEPLGRALAMNGLANIVVDQSHLSGSAREDLKDPQAIHVATAEAVFEHLANNQEIIRKAPEGPQSITERRLIAAHSMGGLASARYVEKYPDLVETYVMLKTVGVNKPILLQIAKSIANGNAAGAIRHDFGPYFGSGDLELNSKNLARAAKYLGIGWPILRDRSPTRAMGEGLSCLTGDTRDSLIRIGEQGTKRIGIEAGRDPLIAQAYDYPAYLDKYILFPKYGHMMPQSRANLVAQTILSAREDLRFKDAQSAV